MTVTVDDMIKLIDKRLKEFGKDKDESAWEDPYVIVLSSLKREILELKEQADA